MELWNLYDRDMQKTDDVIARGQTVPEGRYHMVVHVIIFGSDGRMLIQQRQPFKAGWPNLWDVSVGGSAIMGDTSRAAAQREVMEELGLDLDLSNERPKVTIHFSVGFDDVYTITRDVDLNALTLQESEVQAVRWADEEEIHRMIDDGRFIPYHHSLISLIFALRTCRGNVSRREHTAP